MQSIKFADDILLFSIAQADPHTSSQELTRAVTKADRYTKLMNVQAMFVPASQARSQDLIAEDLTHERVLR